MLAGLDWQALWLTLRLASATTAILLLVALPLGAWLALTQSAFARIVNAVVTLPLVLPPTVLGFYLLVLMSPRTLPGRVAGRMLGHPLAFSFAGLVTGSVLYSLPFAVQPIQAGFAAIDSELLDAARMLGSRGLDFLGRVLIPLSMRSIAAACVLSFAHTVGEFGVVLMLGGGIPGRTRTLSISIYDQVQVFDYAGATRTSLLLVIVSFTALLFLYSGLLGGRRSRHA